MNLPVPATTAAQMTLLAHLRELRTRALWSVAWLVLGTVIAYSYTPELFKLLTSTYYESFTGSLLIGTGPAEAFILKLKVAIFAGLIGASPLIFHQGWLFIAPGLLPHERRWAIPFIAIATGLFATGVYFCHSVVLPLSFAFFRDEYESIGITPTVTISAHLSLLMQSLLGFGIAFELPVIAFILGRLGVIDHRTLISGARYAVVAIFIVAGVLTPPDAITQLLMAGPLLLLYATSIGVLYLTGSRSTEQTSS